MSYVGTSGVVNPGGMTAYVFFGKNGPTKTNNIKAKHSRAVATYCETSIKDFIEKARKIQKKGRKVACIGIVQSFEATEFDYKSKDDAQAVNDLGWELAHKLYPNSECLVVTHNDGDGHKLHNHIQVLNEDMTTGKAIKENRQLYKMRTVNDELMREHGLSVIVPEKGLIKTPRNEFQKTLQQKLKKILTSADAPTDLGAYADACKKQGIDIKLDEKKAKKGKEDVDVVGLTYRMRFAEKKPDYYNPDRTVVRIRRSKASRLGTMFTFEGLLQQFELIKQRKKEQEKAKLRKAKPIAPPVKPEVKPEPQPQKPKRKKIIITQLNVGNSNPYVSRAKKEPAITKKEPKPKTIPISPKTAQKLKKSSKKEFEFKPIPTPWETEPSTKDDEYDF